jgi:hypothetical protein
MFGRVVASFEVGQAFHSRGGFSSKVLVSTRRIYGPHLKKKRGVPLLEIAQFHPLARYYPDAGCGCRPPEIGVGRCRGQMEAHGKRQVCRVVVRQSVFLCDGWQFEKFATKLKLHFVSLRSSLHYVGLEGLSRVKMNAQKTGALDSPSQPKGKVCFIFRLTRPTTS